MAEEQHHHHPIFVDIDLKNLSAVQQHVLADPAVLEERAYLNMTPLMRAISSCQDPTIALWLIEHRGQHDLNTRDGIGWTALIRACSYGRLPVAKALIAAGTSPSPQQGGDWTPLMAASYHGLSHIVVFLLGLPAVRSTIDSISIVGYTALAVASRNGHTSVVQLLIDRGADPTITTGQHSPLNEAISGGHTAIALLLRSAMAEADRARFLLKARALLDALSILNKAHQDAHDKLLSVTEQQRSILAVTPAYLKERVAWGKTLPGVELTPSQAVQEQQELEQLRAVAVFTVGAGESKAMLAEHFEELMAYMAPP
jgi:ankyrin repeat protein